MRRSSVTNGCCIGLVSVTPLRIMVELLEGILTNIEFRIDPVRKCIQVMSMDPAGVCVATAKLSCDIQANGKYHDTFTVSSAIMKTCLKTLNAYHSLDIVYNSDTVASEIVLMAHEVSSSATTKFQLPVLDIPNRQIGAFDLAYDFVFELELNALRNITKNAILLKGDEIQFIVRANAKYIELTIATDGGAKQEHVFVAGRAAPSIPIRIDEGAEFEEDALRSMATEYSHRFSVSYVNKFIAAESQVIALRLSKNKPLILNYPLGVGDSFVSFILSPRMTNPDNS